MILCIGIWDLKPSICFFFVRIEITRTDRITRNPRQVRPERHPDGPRDARRRPAPRQVKRYHDDTQAVIRTCMIAVSATIAITEHQCNLLLSMILLIALYHYINYCTIVTILILTNNAFPI